MSRPKGKGKSRGTGAAGATHEPSAPSAPSGGGSKVVLDDRNANRGTERGLGMLEHSLRTYGAGRSALVDKNGRAIAGNKTIERALELGLPLQIVESDGRRLVVVKRTDLDLDSANGRALAVADNRIAEVDLAWDPEVLAQLAAEGVPLDAFWMPDELKKLLESAPEKEAPGAFPSPNVDPASLVHQCPKCGFRYKAGAVAAEAPPIGTGS